MQTPDSPTPSENLTALTAEAESALASENWEAAVEAYRRLILRQPKNADHRFNLAHAYDEMGRSSDALAVLQDPAIAGLEKTKRRLARTYIDLKDYPAAIALVDELIAAHPDNPKFAKWRAVCEEKSGPDQIAAQRMQQGQDLVAARRLHEAEQLYVQLLRDYPGIPRAYLHLGQIYAEQKRWADAIEPLRSGLALEPGHIKLKSTLARVLFKSGEPSEAIALLNRGQDVGSDPDNLFLLQRCHVELHDWEAARNAGERLLAMLPADSPLRARVEELEEEIAVRHELASIQSSAETGTADMDFRAYRHVIERHPNSRVAWLALGSALSDAGKDDEAADALREASEALPLDVDIAAALTRAVITAGDEERILRHATAVTADGQGDFEAFRWLARYRAERGEWQESLESVRGAVALDPGSASARAMLVRALTNLGELQEALQEVEVLLATGEKHVEALHLKGDIFVRLSRFEEAITLYCQGLHLSYRNAPLTDRLNDALLLNSKAEDFPLQTLGELPIAVEPAAIEEAMRPFLGSEIDDWRWNKRHKKFWRAAIDRVAAGEQARRDRSLVEQEYAVWATMGFERYRTDRDDLQGTPWMWRGRRLFVDGAAAARLRSVLIAAVLNQLKPRRVLEVGSGNGINLLTLAGAFPDIEFTGVELTQEGVDEARRAQSDEEIAGIMREYCPVPTLVQSALGRISFVQGDASALPFEDNNFDLVMTVLAVEQMESIRSAALSEIARVSNRHVLMLEPFRDMNHGGLQALYVQSRGYFRGSISELRDFGLEPLWATADFPQETFLGTALVLAEERAT